MRAYFHLPYRQTEGVIREHASNTLPSIPDYSNINRKINRLDIKVNNHDKSNLQYDDYFYPELIPLVLKLQIEGNGLDINGMLKEVISKYI